MSGKYVFIGDGTLTALAADGGSDLVGFILAGSGASSTTVQDVLRKFIFADEFAGYDATGATSSVTAIVNADAAARAAKLDLIITGTPLVDSTITLSAKTKWIFVGASGRANGDLPSSYLKKAASLSGPALVIAADGTVFSGGGIVGIAGNTGDNLQVKANGFSWTGAPYFSSAGNDNIRIGADTGPSNANGFFFDHPTSCQAGQHGININDKPAGAPDANAGLINSPFSHHNTGAGIYFNNANLGNVVIAPILENNGVGLQFDTLANRNVILGGDIEVNTSNITDASTSFGNRIVNVTVNGVVINTDTASAAWVPLLYGATSAGAGTYSVQKGSYTFTGGLLQGDAEVTWSAHTGTGQIYMDIPALTGGSIASRVAGSIPGFMPVTVIPSGIVLAAGAQMVGLMNTASNPPRVQFYTSNAGTLASQAIAAAGTIYVNWSVPIVSL